MTIRAIIVDDELAAIGNLSDLLIKSGRVDIVGEYTNPLTALESLKSIQADIAFLDIEMPGINGMTLANRILDISGDIKIVFVTAYREYALKVFALYTTDYLLKPVSMDRLTITLDRWSRLTMQQDSLLRFELIDEELYFETRDCVCHAAGNPLFLFDGREGIVYELFMCD
jgi:two-component SAPR family response regulator